MLSRLFVSNKNKLEYTHKWGWRRSTAEQLKTINSTVRWKVLDGCPLTAQQVEQQTKIQVADCRYLVRLGSTFI